MAPGFSVIGVPGIPMVESGDDLSEIISGTLKAQDLILEDGDVLCLAQKIISKQEGRMIELSTVQPSLLAQGISSQYNKDPALVELILSESKICIMSIVSIGGRFVSSWYF